MPALLSSLALAAAFATAGAFATRSTSIRAGIFIGGGTSAGSAGNYSAALQQLAASGSIASVQQLDEAGIAALKRSEFDIVVFPGGSGSQESAAIGAAGATAVKNFVKAGGGYLGTCAGSYLAGNSSCCDQAIPGYCGNKVGCAQSSWTLGLVDMGVAEPWDRGHGLVTISFSAAAVKMLQLDGSKYGPGINTTIVYWQGPVQDRAYPTNGYATLATFTSEIDYLHTQYTKGQQIHTPALISTTYGQGRVLLSSPHPEETAPMLLDLIEAYVHWAGQAI